jgi:hypothetical protein
MISLMRARMRRRFKASPSMVETKKAVWAISERVLPIGNRRITRNFRMFSPCSAGSARSRATLTILAANQTFPLLLELLSRAGRHIETPVPIESYVDDDDKRVAAERLKELCD